MPWTHCLFCNGMTLNLMMSLSHYVAGHAYIQVACLEQQSRNKHHPGGVDCRPRWFGAIQLATTTPDNMSHLEHLVTCDALELCKKHAGFQWPRDLSMKQVHAVARTINPESIGGVHVRLSQYGSDDSDLSDDEEIDLSYGVADNAKVILTSIRKDQRERARNIEVDQAILPQLVVSGLHALPTEDNEDDKELLEQEKISFLESSIKNQYPRMAEWINGTLKKPMKIIKKPSSGNRRDHTIKAALNKFGFEKFKRMQHDVCLAAMEKPAFIFYVAPCGTGKSLCFLLPVRHVSCIEAVSFDATHILFAWTGHSRRC